MTLGVADLARATRFYEEVLALPRLPSPPTVTFFELGRTWLSLYPRELLAEDAGVPAEGYFADPDGFLWEVAWNPHFPHLD